MEGIIRFFGIPLPLGTDLVDPKVDPESILDTFHLASMVVDEVSTSGARARIEAKRATWQGFGDPETHCLAAIVQEAQLGPLSEENYKSYLDELVGTATRGGSPRQLLVTTYEHGIAQQLADDTDGASIIAIRESGASFSLHEHQR